MDSLCYSIAQLGAWVYSRRMTQSQLDAVLTAAGHLSKGDLVDTRTVIEFLRHLPASFSPRFWPQSYCENRISSFYVDFLGYAAPEFGADVARCMVKAFDTGREGFVLSKVFLMALSATVSPTEGVRLINHLLDHYSKQVKSLEKLEIAFNFICQILGTIGGAEQLVLHRVITIGKRQLQSVPAFFEKQHPKALTNKQLIVYRAAALMQVKCVTLLGSDSESLTTLALFKDAAEACLNSEWRNLTSCEELFASLLGGITLMAIATSLKHQQSSVSLVYLKSLVMSACTQGDKWGSCQGPMLESLIKTSCEIIEFVFSKDRRAVNTFILGLVVTVRGQIFFNAKDVVRPALNVQLNVISMLVDLAVRLNKAEVVEMIVSEFIQWLTLGDASSPGLQRLRLLDALSHLASLGFKQSYLETVDLMSKFYIYKFYCSTGTAVFEEIETLSAGFLRIASGLANNSQLRSDYRDHLLDLCSDVAFAAQFKNGCSGADFLNPLLPAVAVICSDFDLTGDIEFETLKLYCLLWYYIAHYGLVLRIPESRQITEKLTRNSQNNYDAESACAAALQAVDTSSPGGSTRFETAHSKLSQLLDPSGEMRSDGVAGSCVKGYRAARQYLEDGVITTVQLMLDCGLPCFGMGRCKRFRAEMSDKFMYEDLIDEQTFPLQ